MENNYNKYYFFVESDTNEIKGLLPDWLLSVIIKNITLKQVKIHEPKSPILFLNISSPFSSQNQATNGKIPFFLQTKDNVIYTLDQNFNNLVLMKKDSKLTSPSFYMTCTFSDNLTPSYSKIYMVIEITYLNFV